MSQAEVFIATSCITTVQQLGNMLMVSHQELAEKKQKKQIQCVVRLYCFSPSHIHLTRPQLLTLFVPLTKLQSLHLLFLHIYLRPCFLCSSGQAAAANHINYIHPIPCLTYIKPRTTQRYRFHYQCCIFSIGQQGKKAHFITNCLKNKV